MNLLLFAWVGGQKITVVLVTMEAQSDGEGLVINNSRFVTHGEALLLFSVAVRIKIIFFSSSTFVYKRSKDREAPCY